MASIPKVEHLAREWSGTKKLWLSPGEQVYESPSTAQVSTVAQGQHLAVAYTWAIENEPQDGLILFHPGDTVASARAVWLDSWRMRDDMMVCEQKWGAKGQVRLEGPYSAPPGPDWGWRIEIELDADASLVIRMISITPEGQEFLAVLAQYRRVTEAA